MREVKIKAYQYEELTTEAQYKVIAWLDNFPLEYDDENGIRCYQSFNDIDEEDIKEHCEANEYLFSKDGEVIHHLIIDKEKELKN